MTSLSNPSTKCNLRGGRSWENHHEGKKEVEDLPAAPEQKTAFFFPYRIHNPTLPVHCQCQVLVAEEGQRRVGSRSGSKNSNNHALQFTCHGAPQVRAFAGLGGSTEPFLRPAQRSLGFFLSSDLRWESVR